MAPESLKAWLADMKSAGLAKTDADCARMLGISHNGLIKMKANGSNRRTALACKALLHRLEPYECT